MNIENIGSSRYRKLIAISTLQKVFSARTKVRSMKMRKLKFFIKFLSHYRRHWKAQIGRCHFWEGLLPFWRAVRQIAGRRGPWPGLAGNADAVKNGV